MSDRQYPDSVAGDFTSPPISFVDTAGRRIRIEPDDGDDRTFESLVAMYDTFDPADRAQGIPPATTDRIREWLNKILTERCLNLIAWHDQKVAGHTTLVADDGEYELAIFVHQSYQEASIGTHLMESILAYGGENGVNRVWLSVERWNKPAIGLYEQVGFEISNTESFELEMTLRLQDTDTPG